MPLGRNLLTSSILQPTRVSADGNPKYKAGGIVLDLAVIPTAPAADVTLPDGSIIRAGQQYLRYGQIITQETGFDVQTLAVTGTPTGGTFTLTYGGVASAAIPFNATAAQVEAALNTIPALAAFSPTFTGGPFPGTNVVMTVSGVPLVLALGTNSFTGGASPTATVTHTTTGTATAGKFGPYDSAASDGRQTLTRSRCFILDETWLLNPAGNTFAGLGSTDTIGGLIEGGDVWFDRLLITGGTHSLAAGPTIAEFEAAFPRVTYYRNQ